MAYNQGTLYGSYVPTTNVWDVSELADLDITSPAFKELLIRLYQNLNRMSDALNTKDSAWYDTTQFITGHQFFPNPAAVPGTAFANTPRPVTRMVVNFGALPNAGTKSVAHGITVNSGTTWTRIYGAATDPVGLKGIPLPFYAVANGVQLDIDATNVNVTTTSNLSAYTTTIIVLEYMTY